MMVGALQHARKLVAGATAAILASGAMVFAPTAAQAAPGDASATSVAINLNAGINIPPLVNIPLVGLTTTLGTAVAPPGGGTSQSGLLNLGVGGLGVTTAGSVTSTAATRTAAGSTATSEIAGVNIGVLGLSAVALDAVSATATCPAGAAPTAAANVANLRLLGQAVTLNASTPTVSAGANVNVLGLAGARLNATARQVTTTTATSASSAAVLVDLGLSATVTLTGTTVNVPLGTIALAQASCQAPNATIASVTPTTGPTSGGTVVTVTGNGLQNATGVTVGGVPATSVTPSADGTSLTAVTPASEAAGTVPIVVNRPTGDVAAGSFTYVAPTISAVDPPQGTTAGGTTVTITGTGLAGATGISFGGVAGRVTASTPTSVTAVTPPHAAGTVPVTVTLPGADASATGAFTYVPPTNPTVATIAPAEGPAAGGTAVTLTGTNLGNATAVTFGGTPGTITARTATTLTVTTPPHAAGPVAVAVTNPAGTTTAADPFTYLDDGSGATFTGIAPAQVPTAGGTTVTISGTGLGGATGVTVGGVAATGVTATPTGITATVPARETAGAAPVVVQFPAGTRAAGTVTYVAPTITAVAPAQGPAAGGTAVTLTGTGFGPATGVTLGGQAATITAQSPTSLTVTAPAHAPGPVDVVVVAPGADATAAGAFTYLDDGTGATVTGLTPATSPTAGGGTLTVTGTGLAGATGLLVGGTAATGLTVAPDGTGVSGTVPASAAAGPVDVALVFPGGQVVAGPLVYVAPTIALSPAQGTDQGGTTVTLTGTGLAGATGVTFDGVAGTGLDVVSDTELTVTTPAHAPGAVDVVVALPGLDATAAGGYAYLAEGAATVTGVDPAEGPVAGGTVVTLTGTDLATVSGVLFDGVPGTGLDVVSGTGLTVTSPPHAAGPVTLTVTNESGDSLLPAGFTYLADGTDATVDGLAPVEVPTAGGTTVTVTGTGLTGATGVTVGGVPATDVVVAPGGGTLTFTTPAGETGGAAPVVIAFPLGTVEAGDLTYVAPTLDALDPAEGPTSGGTTVTLTGTGLEAATGVTFGGVAATDLAVVGPGEITVTSPAQGAGDVTVAVELPGADPAELTFTYLDDGADAVVDGVAPAALPTSGGTVTVTGSGLAGATGMTVGGVPVVDLVAADGAVTGTVPPAEAGGPQDVVLQFPGGEVPAGTVELLAPAVTGVQPAFGVSSGGNQVVLTGTGLGAATEVALGGTPAEIVAVAPDGTSVTVTAPPGAPGAADVVVTLPGADAVLDDGYRYLDDGSGADVSGLAPAEVPTTGGTTITVSGTGLGGVTGATVGGVLAGGLTVAPDGTSVSLTAPPSEAGGPATVTLIFEAGSAVAGTVTYVAPALTGVDPAEGTAAGGTSVTLTGTGLTGASGVTFGGEPATITAVAPDGTGLTVTTPAHAPGAVDVVVELTGADAVLAGAFAYLDGGGAATVDGLDPAQSPTAGGGTLTVTGTGLGAVTGVTVGGVPAGDLVVAPDGTSVTVTIPAADAAGPADVVLAFPAGTVAAGALEYVAPTLAGADPAEGLAAGGTSVTLTGTGLAGATGVAFGGVAAEVVDVAADGTSITVTSPPHAAGPVDVVVALPGPDATLPGGFTYLEDGSGATVTGVTPTSSPTAGGGTVTVTGTGLTGATGLTVDGVPATGVTASPDGTSVSAVLPASDAAGPAAVVVVFPEGTLPAGEITYVAPTVTGVAPAEGGTGGGTLVTVTGTGLTGATGVLLGGTPGVGVTVAPDGTGLTVTTPPGAAGPVDVVVQLPGVDATLADGFTYVDDGTGATVDGTAPATSPTAGGGTLTLTGTGLAGVESVTVGGVAVPVETRSDTGITVTIPPADAAGEVAVVLGFPSGATVLAGALEYVASTVTAVDPAAGPQSGGTGVTVTGTDLGAVTAVLVDGVAVTPTEVTATSVTFETPEHAPGAVDLVLEQPGADVTLAGAFTYQPDGSDAVVGDLTPGTVPLAGGVPVTITGTGLTGATGVTVGGEAATDVVVADDGTSITFTTPPGAEPGAEPVVITYPGGGEVAAGDLTYADDGSASAVDGVDPATVPTSGGPITVTGTGLGGVSGATVGGTPVAVTVVSGTEVTVQLPPTETPGAVPVVLEFPAGTLPAGDVTYVAATVTAVDPAEGPQSGGTSVTLTGTGLGAVTAVLVDGAPVTPTEVTATSVTFTTPEHAPGPVGLVLVQPGADLEVPDAFTYLVDGSDAVVGGLEPGTVPLAGGVPVTITGTGLTGATGVTVGGVAATDVVVADDGTSITFTAPPGTEPGADPVVITYPADGEVPAGDLTYADDGSASTVDGVEPATVPTAGGTVTVSGTGLDGVSGVTVAGSPVDFTVVSGTEVTVVLPPSDAPGAVPVQLEFPAGSLPAGVVTYALPAVDSVEPAAGPQSGGTSVTLTGTGLGAVTGVLVDGVAVPPSAVTATSVTFTTPEHAPGAVDLVLVAPGADATLAAAFTYQADGSDADVTGLDPAEVPLAGGVPVTLTGTGLTGATGVTVGGTAALDVVVADDGTSITFTAPPGAGTGPAAVVVTYPGGGEVPAGDLTYVEDGSGATVGSVTPATAPTAGGVPITVTGTGLAGATGLTVGGVAVADAVPSADGTTLTGTLPASETAGAAPVVITFPAGEVAAGTVTYAGPVLTGLSPAQGPVAGGTTVTISGSGLAAATGVTFGGVPATGLTVVSGGLTVVAPAGAAGPADVVVELPGADAVRAGGYGYVPEGGPFLGGLTPSTGPTAGGTTVTLTGTGLGTVSGVTFGGVPATIVGTPTADQVVVTTPAHGAGPVDVAVTNAAGTGVLPGAYTYQTPAGGPVLRVAYYAPRVGPTSGGQTVLITGTGFVPGQTSVTFGGTPAESVAVLSGTAVVAVSPPGPEGVWPLVVSVAGVDAVTLGYEYDADAAPVPAAPVATGADPSDLDAGGGTPVTVGGTGFVPGDTSVVVCGTLVPADEVAVAADGTSLTFTAPACAPGAAEIVVVTPGGTASLPVTYYASEVLAAADDPADPAAGASDPLAVTGSDIGREAPWWAAGLVLWGVGLLLVRRYAVRRRAARPGGAG